MAKTLVAKYLIEQAYALRSRWMEIKGDHVNGDFEAFEKFLNSDSMSISFGMKNGSMEWFYCYGIAPEVRNLLVIEYIFSKNGKSPIWMKLDLLQRIVRHGLRHKRALLGMCVYPNAAYIAFAAGPVVWPHEDEKAYKAVQVELGWGDGMSCGLPIKELRTLPRTGTQRRFEKYDRLNPHWEKGVGLIMVIEIKWAFVWLWVVKTLKRLIK